MLSRPSLPSESISKWQEENINGDLKEGPGLRHKRQEFQSQRQLIRLDHFWISPSFTNTETQRRKSWQWQHDDWGENKYSFSWKKFMLFESIQTRGVLQPVALKCHCNCTVSHAFLSHYLHKLWYVYMCAFVQILVVSQSMANCQIMSKYRKDSRGMNRMCEP